MQTRAFVAILALAVLTAPAFADEVQLKNGKSADDILGGLCRSDGEFDAGFEKVCWRRVTSVAGRCTKSAEHQFVTNAANGSCQR